MQYQVAAIDFEATFVITPGIFRWRLESGVAVKTARQMLMSVNAGRTRAADTGWFDDARNAPPALDH